MIDEKDLIKEKNLIKIENLRKALHDIGIGTDLYLDEEWCCSDGKTHYGIELATDIDCGDYGCDFIFTPQGEYVNSCLECPIVKK